MTEQAVVSCENCGAPMVCVPSGDYLVCPYCTTLHFLRETRDGVRVIGKASRLRCVVCHIPLLSGVLYEEEVLCCPRCEGILMEQRVLGLLVSRYQQRPLSELPSPRILSLEERTRRICCPQCERMMENHPYYGPARVLMDSCAACRHAWLDRNELSRILRP